MKHTTFEPRIRIRDYILTYHWIFQKCAQFRGKALSSIRSTFNTTKLIKSHVFLEPVMPNLN